ncbi:hypothetical protein BD311DRAFT_755944 [Dichomitus squalens]|uniref:Uncharacterized protein n=1 Tax=Dichomitus squalens TaxID=114155 RepID=A0A4Q9MTR8_9APHY|nr:hypothetical protein BD311DRAFT_755944 [Dichomitus squalens]
MVCFLVQVCLGQIPVACPGRPLSMPISSLRIHTSQSALRLSLLGVETCVAGVHPQIIPTANRCEPFTSSLCSQVSFSSGEYHALCS